MTVTAPDFLAWLRDPAHKACEDGYAWAEANNAVSIQDAWERLERPDWMIWLAQAAGVTLDRDAVVAWAFEMADRAVRIHAPLALSAAGLTVEADKLRALPKIDSESAARSAARSAESAENKLACDLLRARIPTIGA